MFNATRRLKQPYDMAIVSYAERNALKGKGEFELIGGLSAVGLRKGLSKRLTFSTCF